MGRTDILKSIRENKPSLVPLPNIDIDRFEEEVDLMAIFKEKVALVGGSVQELSSPYEIESTIKGLFPDAINIVDNAKATSLGTVSVSENTDPHELETVDLAIINGVFGIAENGAVWITDRQFTSRVLPFITDDLVIILNKKNLHPHLHKAYGLLSKRERSFGLFISGPSKTADIEQCLVIGAQGALGLSILLI